jgi:hypothetical protein
VVGHIITTDFAQERLKTKSPITKINADEVNIYTQSNRVALPVLANTNLKMSK